MAHIRYIGGGVVISTFRMQSIMRLISNEDYRRYQAKQMEIQLERQQQQMQNQHLPSISSGRRFNRPSLFENSIIRESKVIA